MIKKNKYRLIISSALILLPAVAGLILWNKLPVQIATHWGIGGQADGEAVRGLAVFGLPLFMLVTHWICILVMVKDPKNKNQNGKVFGMVLWIAPIVSFFSGGIIYSTAFGKTVNIFSIEILLLGLLFAVLGNCLPKCKQNYIIGVRVKWALENEENWNATHRFCGKLWVAGGLLMMLGIFLPSAAAVWIMLVLLAVLSITPVVYSYAYYKKQLKNGTIDVGRSEESKVKQAVVAAAIIILVAAVLLILMCAGNISIQYADSSFTVHTSFWSDITVDYSDIDAGSLEYREDVSAGRRTYGFGSPRLLAGNFNNDEFGDYIRYSYTGCASCVVLKANGETLVISDADEAKTKEIYDELSARI